MLASQPMSQRRERILSEMCAQFYRFFLKLLSLSRPETFAIPRVRIVDSNRPQIGVGSADRGFVAELSIETSVEAC